MCSAGSGDALFGTDEQGRRDLSYTIASDGSFGQARNVTGNTVSGRITGSAGTIEIDRGSNVVADCDGTEYSQAWLRLKSGDMYSRGSEGIGSQVRRHFQVSPVNALRIRKSAEDNGMQIPLSFIADLTGNDESELAALARQRGYSIGD